MPQIYVILDPYLAKNYCNGEGLDAFFQDLVPVIERQLGIEGKNDVAITVVQAVRTVGEANVQIELRYTAGAHEYGHGKPFDPGPAQLERLMKLVHREFVAFQRRSFSSPSLTLSVWCKPYRGGAFKLFK
jgi:hypothetical protein